MLYKKISAIFFKTIESVSTPRATFEEKILSNTRLKNLLQCNSSTPLHAVVFIPLAYWLPSIAAQ